MNLEIAAARRQAIVSTVDRVRAILNAEQPTQTALEKIQRALLDLAARTELFPEDDFPIAAGYDGVIYRLHEDPDHSHALFASVGQPGKARAIHNHTTWAVIAAVRGDEHNIVYERVDDGHDGKTGRLHKVIERTIRPGQAIAMLPDDFHSIEVRGDKPSVHLHMYGMSHAFLPDRIGFTSPDGGPIIRYPLSYSIGLCTPQALRQMLGDGRELAIIDVREEGIFARDGHLLVASNLPLSHLEVRAPLLLPRRSVRIVVCDEDDGLSQIAATRLMKAGYSDVSVLEGGTPAWIGAGERLYTGVYVPSKAFGEYVHHHDHTPEIDAAQLTAWKNSGRDLLILDSRPFAEYRRQTIPGSIDCPGVELGYRIHSMLRSPETTVVVNCGGRTRGIIGAQALINAGIANRVYALKDGTQGWHLAGFPLARGNEDRAPLPTATGLKEAKEDSAKIAQRYGVQTITRAQLQSRQALPDQTLYLFDVRTPEEYSEGHLPGSVLASGGQLIQATDTWIAVRHGNIVLVDDNGVRATMTAAWLNQMGFPHVFVLQDGLSGAQLVGGVPAVEPLNAQRLKSNAISVADLSASIRSGGVQVVDLDFSLNYINGHIPGAWHAVRSRLERDVGKIPGEGPMVFTSPDGLLARFSAADATYFSKREISVLEGGTAAWRSAGLALESGDERLTGPADDMRYRALEQRQGVENAIRDYLKWEVNLLEATSRDPDFMFRRYP